LLDGAFDLTTHFKNFSMAIQTDQAAKKRTCTPDKGPNFMYAPKNEAGSGSAFVSLRG
jgi:hypothetical protein